MSKYTTEVRFICEQKAGLKESQGADKIDNIIESSWDKIFTTKCPFFDEEYRKHLCKKIIKHYYLREIASETVGIWLLWMNTRLEEIMPYYNQLYKSELLKFDPFGEVDYSVLHDETIGRNGNTDSTSKNVDKFSDTPQGGISDLESGKYLTNADIVEGKGNVKSNSNDVIKGKDIYKGKQSAKSYSKMLNEFRKTMLNIDMQVIAEFKDLFLMIW